MAEESPRPADESLVIDRRRVLSATAGGLAIGSLGLPGVGAAESDGTVTILHDTHFHGRFGDPADAGAMDIARYQAIVAERSAARDDALFLGIGDDIAPSIMGLAYEGEHMIEALNYAAPAAVGAGNHEFDFGIDVATDRFAESEFPWVVANLLTPDGEPIPGTERWITREVGDLTVGIFGCGVGDFHSITDYPDEYRAIDPVEASLEATAALKDEGADVVVLASHADHEDHYEIAEAVDDLDAIVGSHSGVTFDEPEVHEGTIISEFGDEFDHLGELTLDADGTLVRWERYDLDPGAIDPDPEMAEIVGRWRDALVADYGDDYFTSEVELDARFDTNYARESRLGNLICDLMVEYAESNAGAGEIHVALTNAGGIRSNSRYGPGGITGLDWLDVLPFPNTIVTMAIDGATLETLLESQVAALPWASFGAQQAVQVAGVQYEWSGHFGEPQVDGVYVGGEPLDPDGTYTFVTNDYVAGWDLLEDATVLHESDEFVGFVTLDALEGRTVSPEIDHRILRVDADAGAPTDVVRRRGETRLRYDAPDAIDAIREGTFYAVTQDGERLDPKRVCFDGDDLRIVFRTGDLQSFLRGDPDRDLRVFGGFNPDRAYYGYEDGDGEPIDLPVAAAWEYFVAKASVPGDAVRG